VCGRRESYEKKACVRIAEAWDASTPVRVVAMCALLLMRDAPAVLTKAGASFA
jgi:hypothetical protein